MPVEFTSASVGEPAQEPDVVLIDDADVPPQVMGERLPLLRPCADLVRSPRDDTGAEFSAARVRAIENVLRALVRARRVAQLLRLKESIVNDRLREAMRACEAYRAIDRNNVSEPQGKRQHRIDMIA